VRAVAACRAAIADADKQAEFDEYVRGRGYTLLTPAAYGRVRGAVPLAAASGVAGDQTRAVRCAGARGCGLRQCCCE
jgi:hypothetical protein